MTEEEKPIDVKDEKGIINTEISIEMKKAYLDYAMSVIVSRAIPSVEDGLKPVQRRILYLMQQLGLKPNSQTKKSARIVGDVIGKYHPHGDTAAAMRYTEARIMDISSELLQDIDKETVNFVPNYDNSLKEPELLPGKLPNLLLNGASGIAVGMATNIPPHNLTEVCDAIVAYIKNKNISFEELCEIVKGPDFPTGGSIQGDMLELYKTGIGKLIMRGKITTEQLKNKEAIIITEIPYMLNKTLLVTQIAGLVQDKKLKDISDLRDESSRGKTRIVIELKKGVSSNFVINALYKYTRVQDSFNVNLLALHSGQPKVMNLKEVLDAYVNYRKLIITNRSKYELKKAKERQEIVQGLLIALIKKSKSAVEASEGLIKKYKLTKVQAQAILDIKLQQLTSLEVSKLEKEY